MDFIGDSGGFTRDKTGLFGAVWIDDREVGWGNLGAGGFFRIGGLFLDPGFTTVNSGVHPMFSPIAF